MKKETIQWLQCPKTKENLILNDSQKAFLENQSSTKQYYFHKSFPIFLPREDMLGENRKFAKFYNVYSVVYDAILKISALLKKEYQTEYQKTIQRMAGFAELKPGYRILEVTIGTGNIMAAFPAPDNAELYGLDISIGMLTKCAKKMKKRKKPVELFQGEAENLPFKDQIFDVVYSVGGINFFNDKQKAIQEIIRVAKPGAKIIISDETEKLIAQAGNDVILNQIYDQKFYNQKNESLKIPVDLIPVEMINVKPELIIDGYAYIITFTKPG